MISPLFVQYACTNQIKYSFSPIQFICGTVILWYTFKHSLLIVFNINMYASLRFMLFHAFIVTPQVEKKRMNGCEKSCI